MILINFNLNGERISKKISLSLTTRSLLDSIFFAKSNSLEYIVNNRFFLILLDFRLVYSNLVPAFILNGRSVVTLEGLKKKSFYQHMQKILLEDDFNFCSNCFESNVLLFYYFLENKIVSKSDILGYRNSLKCSCMDVDTFLSLYLKAEELYRKNG
ncbi:hypothetical protein [Borreliella afzelii]|uniref:Uncharacterized protein n=2 Tax=Borreliella afzelii TaxID=29518 RepID=G0IQA5_BORAP|nr:hypothetical protein [Borreliella afzelii]AEL69775.1 conserved hypothetical protein [Borreliella afzelii PKo]AJY72532.1 hypothetical protein BAFK78_555 [Borreliella afzelii K78]EEC21065.1 conserved hypothetical protein [Borreliella afzelii ACA-1]AIK18847.1 hypothetical protein P612_02825 [Borreliella afzelii Tom3107]MBB5140900.1 aerobic-type carbon monoxide dehydrogenase small subunit (CoxS/CutS family) [Borreliella afzelii]